jgi:hypothetical protein
VYPWAISRSTSRSRVVSWSSSGSKLGLSAPALPEPGGIAAKASSTKPASRCENTASPDAIRTIASASSPVPMVLVT